MADCTPLTAISYYGRIRNEERMAIAPLQPHKSWYRHFWYASRSPRDTLLDRTLLFAIVALALIVAGMVLVHRNAAPRQEHAATEATR